jgi:hypothetical protein
MYSSFYVLLNSVYEIQRNVIRPDCSQVHPPSHSMNFDRIVTPLMLNSEVSTRAVSFYLYNFMDTFKIRFLETVNS